MKKSILLLLPALICVLYFSGFGAAGESISTVFISLLLIKISYTDYKTYIIPNRLLFPLAILGSLHQLIHNGFLLVNTAAALLLVSFIFLPVYFLTDSIGGGDVKLAYCLALWLSYPSISAAVTIAALLASLFGICMVLRGRQTLATPVFFGPFLALGGFIAFLFADSIFIFLEKWSAL